MMGAPPRLGDGIGPDWPKLPTALDEMGILRATPAAADRGVANFATHLGEST